MQKLKQSLKCNQIYNTLKKVKRSIPPLPDTPKEKNIYKIPLPTFEVVNVSRLLFFKRMLDIVRDIEGDIVECGVGRGRSLCLLALLCREEEKGRQIWGFDSFAGFPDPTVEDNSPRNPKKGQYPATIEGVRALLYEADLGEMFIRSKITLVKGFFNESLHKYKGQEIALLHIDADLYQSYCDILNILYEHVKPGGVIVLDEYMDGITHYNFPGAKKAIDEFFADKPFNLHRDKRYGKYYLIKPNG